jgi:Na+/H+ antiporter NhaD/arsenite permease-like protein
VAYFSVAFGSNVGALGGTFAASLAGLLWRDALLQRGVVVTKMQFLLWCSIVIVPATVSGIGILLLEVQHFKL